MKDLKPTTLGERLGDIAPAPQPRVSWVRVTFHSVLNSLVWAAAIGLVLWAFVTGLSVEIALGVLICAILWVGLLIWNRPQKAAPPEPHFLLMHDRQGFMDTLRLDAKYVIFDGSNLFHFGLDNDIGGRAIPLLATKLRSEGYRIICFFDSNIFYRLGENGLMAKKQRHDISILMRVFGVHWDEIYIVPSGVQADRYILSTLKHLPISFAVTNDQFRDYGKVYGDVMTGDQWRKGVRVSKGELKLEKFSFVTPLRLGATRSVRQN